MASSNVVVFPTDFSEHSLGALQWAKRIAAILDSELHCLFVVEEPHLYSALDMGPVAIPTTDDLTASAEAQLEIFRKENLRGFSQSSSAKILVGRPADEIMNYAEENDAVMIVMATHGYSGVKHLALGSTTEAVVRQAKCPVFSVRCS
jgi:nucleotide-binding universal stress UspA family protein